jgi:hypothetical protein
VHLFFFDAAAVHLCLGAIGAGGRRFCIKPRMDGGSTCGVLKHSTKFDPQVNHYYLCSNDTMAFYEPCLLQAWVPAEFRGNLVSTKKTIEEWKQVFSDYAILATGRKDISALEGPMQYIYPNPGLLDLKPPKKVQQQLGDRLVFVPIELDNIVNQEEDCALTKSER